MSKIDDNTYHVSFTPSEKGVQHCMLICDSSLIYPLSSQYILRSHNEGFINIKTHVLKCSINMHTKYCVTYVNHWVLFNIVIIFKYVEVCIFGVRARVCACLFACVGVFVRACGGTGGQHSCCMTKLVSRQIRIYT